MGRYEIDRKRETELVLKLYEVDREVRMFIDELYLKEFLVFNGRLDLCIRHNLDKINKFIEERDN